MSDEKWDQCVMTLDVNCRELITVLSLSVRLKDNCTQEPSETAIGVPMSSSTDTLQPKVESTSVVDACGRADQGPSDRLVEMKLPLSRQVDSILCKTPASSGAQLPR